MDYILAVCDENQREVNKKSPLKPMNELTIISEEGLDDGPDPYALAMADSEPVDIDMVDDLRDSSQKYDLNQFTQNEGYNDFVQS